MADMREAHPDSFDANAERDWLAACSIENFLQRISTKHPINLVGQLAPVLQAQLALRMNKGQSRAIKPLGSQQQDSSIASHDEPADCYSLPGSEIGSALLSRSSTIVLNPFFAQWLITQPDLIKTVSLKTFEMVILPFFVHRESTKLFFSEGFSFEEPRFQDEAPHHWRWSTQNSGTVFLLNAGEGGPHRMTFSLGSAAPGVFLVTTNGVSFGKESSGEHAVTFSFETILKKGLNSIKLSFDGPPLQPAALGDERQKLFFNFSGIGLTRLDGGSEPAVISAPPELSTLSDRLIRRTFHDNGFFDIQTIGTPWAGLSGLTGVRSCFDLREGFGLRDWNEHPFESAICPTHLRYSFPVMWYCLRKTPLPGSEWDTPGSRLRHLC